MADDLAALVHEAVRSMRDDEDGRAIASIVRLELEAPAEVVGAVVDELIVAVRRGGTSVELRPQDPAARLPDDAAITELLAVVETGDLAGLSTLVGDSYVGLLVLLVGTLARLTPAPGPTAADAAREVGAVEPDDFRLVSVPLAEITLTVGDAPAYDRVAREQVEWGLDVLVRIIEPAMRMGKGPEYLADRDLTDGCSEQQSYVAMHRWFYEPEQAIRLARAEDGRLEVIRGHDRIAIALQLGIDELPAFVR